MSKKHAHERNKARDQGRIANQQAYEAGRLERKHRDNESQVIDFGKYKRKKLSPAELALEDPSYFFWATTSRVFSGWQQADAEEIGRRCRHIKPPKRNSKDWRFRLKFNKHNKLRGMVLVKTSTALPTKEREFLSKHFDLRWLVDLHTGQFCTNPLVISKLRDLLFGTQTPTKWQCKEFWEDERNFATDCRETHCPAVPLHPMFL